MQTLFPDLSPPRAAKPGAPLHTVFFGLVPPGGVARRAHELARSVGQGDLRPERVLHISLIVVGKDLIDPPPSGLIDGVRACAATVRQRPFTVALDRVEAWRSGPVVARGAEGVVGVEELHHRRASAGSADNLDGARLRADPQPRRSHPLRGAGAFPAMGLTGAVLAVRAEGGADGVKGECGGPASP